DGAQSRRADGSRWCGHEPGDNSAVEVEHESPRGRLGAEGAEHTAPHVIPLSAGTVELALVVTLAVAEEHRGQLDRLEATQLWLALEIGEARARCRERLGEDRCLDRVELAEHPDDVGGLERTHRPR